MSIAARTKNLLDVASSIAVIAMAGAVAWALLRPSDVRTTQNARQRIETLAGQQLNLGSLANTVGTGEIVMVEFSDFQCPFCAKYAREILPTIKRDLVDTGNVRYVSLHFPIEEIHPLALQASEAAECAGRQGQFWEMHARLFTVSGGLGSAELLDHAAALGLDRNDFERCLDRDETLNKIRSDQSEGRRLGVIGTPSFFLGTMQPDGGVKLLKRIRGIVTADVLIEEVDRMKLRTAKS